MNDLRDKLKQSPSHPKWPLKGDGPPTAWGILLLAGGLGCWINGWIILATLLTVSGVGWFLTAQAESRD
jgi:hypothetical protein